MLIVKEESSLVSTPYLARTAERVDQILVGKQVGRCKSNLVEAMVS